MAVVHSVGSGPAGRDRGGRTIAEMSTATPTPARWDHMVRLHDVSWEDYERILAIRGDRSAPRISYLEGELEIMSPSRDHEAIKSLLGRLVEVWCLVHDVEFSTVGSWTVKDREVERGAEPDECYLFGEHDPAAVRPHLALEVVWTSGGIDKLEIYRLLGVGEVWYWEDGVLTVHVLEGDTYREAPASRVLPALDLQQLASFLDRPTTSEAMRAYRAALRDPRG